MKKQQRMNMKMNTTISMLVLALVGIETASAHTTYGGVARNLGPANSSNGLPVETPITGFSAASPYLKTISLSNIGGDSGWAEGTRPEFGDAHHIRAFRFTLAEAGLATIRASATTSGFMPGFSLYSGLLNLSGYSPPYDGSPATIAYLNSIGQDTSVTARALNSLGNVKMYSDADPVSGAVAESALTYFGNAADGTSANFGNAAGIFGDGNQDGLVERQFWLEAGDYTIFLGGANINGVNTANQAASISLAVVPEPSVSLLGAVAGLALVLRRKRG
jgi:hypothetical protein